MWNPFPLRQTQQKAKGYGSSESEIPRCCALHEQVRGSNNEPESPMTVPICTVNIDQLCDKSSQKSNSIKVEIIPKKTSNTTLNCFCKKCKFEQQLLLITASTFTMQGQKITRRRRRRRKIQYCRFKIFGEAANVQLHSQSAVLLIEGLFLAMQPYSTMLSLLPYNCASSSFKGLVKIYWLEPSGHVHILSVYNSALSTNVLCSAAKY